MRETMGGRPAIAIDLKKNRVRIHPRTLQLLGNPAYVRLLVDPKEPIIAVQSSVSPDCLTHCVSSCAQFGYKPFELYSQGLIRTLFEVCPDWMGGQCYRIYGKAIPSKGLVLFHLRDSTRSVE